MKEGKILFDFFHKLFTKDARINLKGKLILLDILTSSYTVLIYEIFKEYFEYIYIYIIDLLRSLSFDC